VVGYDKAAQLAKQAHRDGTSIREAATASGWFSPDQLEKLLDPKSMV